MVNKNRKTGLIIGSIVLLGAAGGIGYWLWKKAKDKKDAEAARLAAEANNSGSTDTTSTDSTKPDSGTTVTTDKPADIKAFQDWMDKTHPNWVNGKNLNQGGGWGNFGSATKSAWAAWKTDYNKLPTASDVLKPTGYVVNDKLESIFVLVKGGQAWSLKDGASLGRYKQAYFLKDSPNGFFVGRVQVINPKTNQLLWNEVTLKNGEWQKVNTKVNYY
jgi:hypothetical protein